tara:strand:+ start:766 stop:1026 length:261 start_codon:yes stop_codon:yes gene_type:complete
MYDKINSIFILVAAIFYLLNLAALIKDKDVKGYSKTSIVFFTIWNFWTLFFFIQILQFWYTIAALSLVCVLNFIYLVLMVKYLYKK